MQKKGGKRKKNKGKTSEKDVTAAQTEEKKAFLSRLNPH